MKEIIELRFELPEGESVYDTPELLDWFATCIVRAKTQGIGCSMIVNGQPAMIQIVKASELEHGNA